MSSAIGPAEDGRGEAAVAAPPPRRRSTLLTVCPFILGNEFCERLAFYGLFTNMVVYLTKVMGEENGTAALRMNLFEGTCYLTPLLGAWLADSLWGRYRTIIVFSCIYFLGMVMLAVSASVPGLTPPPDQYPTALQNAALFASLYVIALGTGGIKPNVSAFGADQFDEGDPRDRKEKRSFFNWFYFFVNIGSLLAVTVIVWVQENVSWAVGFAIPAAAMALAVVTFVAGSPLYTHVEPTESPISRVFKVVWAAWRSRRSSSQLGIDGGEAGANGGVGSLSEPLLLPANGGGGGMGRRTQSLLWLDSATEARVAGGGARRFTQRQVEEVKLVLRLLPIFGATVLYWTIYIQMSTFFVAQGLYMDRDIGLPWGGTFTIPAASLSVINTLAIVVLIPVYDKVLVPALRRWGRPITLLQRIGWGLVVCVLSMLISASVEWYRLKLYHEGHVLRADEALPGFGSGGGGGIGGDAAAGILAAAMGVAGGGAAGGAGRVDGLGRVSCRGATDAAAAGGTANHHYCVVDMSIWWQVPQYLAVGLSEVFTSIGQLELFYDQAPDVMRSCSMALQLLSVAIGSYLSGALVWGASVITSRLDPLHQGWLPKDLNQGRLDLFLLLLGVLMLFNLVHFLVVAARYEYKAVEHVKRVTLPRSLQRPPLPRPPARGGPPQRSVPVAAASLAHPVPGAPGAASSPAPAIFSRSVTFMPKSPAMPAPMR